MNIISFHPPLNIFTLSNIKGKEIVTMTYSKQEFQYRTNQLSM